MKTFPTKKRVPRRHFYFGRGGGLGSTPVVLLRMGKTVIVFYLTFFLQGKKNVRVHFLCGGGLIFTQVLLRIPRCARRPHHPIEYRKLENTFERACLAPPPRRGAWESGPPGCFRLPKRDSSGKMGGWLRAAASADPRLRPRPPLPGHGRRPKATAGLSPHFGPGRRRPGKTGP